MNVSVGWDRFWDETYQKTNGLWLAVIYLATVVVSFTFVGFSVAFLQSLWSNKYDVAFRHYLWILVTMMFLADNGAMLANLTYGMRAFAIDQTKEIYQIQIGGVAIEEALKDILVTGDVKQQIAAAFRDCESKTGQAQIDCIKLVGQYAEKKISDAESRWGPLAGLIRLGDRIVDNTSVILTSPPNPSLDLDKRRLNDPILGSLATAILHIFLKSCQWCFSNLFELAFAMTGLYGPIAIALSTLPLPTRFIWYWLLSFLTTAAAIWSYAVMVGLIAWIITISDTQTYADTAFLMFIGLGAPILSWALAAGGGTAIWRSATSHDGFSFGRILF
ncbi:MAG: hypothetical protein HC820_04950 [Hydrococcus sp. RM1_1_31]|nr:hypothetical protein [Hydrococcus sp. RM1_1_31]